MDAGCTYVLFFDGRKASHVRAINRQTRCANGGEQLTVTSLFIICCYRGALGGWSGRFLDTCGITQNDVDSGHLATCITQAGSNIQKL